MRLVPIVGVWMVMMRMLNSVGGCKAGSVGEYKEGGCGLNVCDGGNGG